MRNRSNFLLHATFRKAVEKKKPEDLLSIDVNEKSVDLAIVKPGKIHQDRCERG